MLDIAARTPPGCMVEIGVYQGGSAMHLLGLAREQKRNLYLYDTFTGIPCKSEWDSHAIGDFSDTSLEYVQARCPGAVITPGRFPSSAIAMEPIAFVHLDCDQYQSYRESLTYLLPKMLPGGVMWFDDSPCLAGALKAVTEVFGPKLKLSGVGKHYVEV